MPGPFSADTVRRIVTGNDSRGKAVFVSDTRVPKLDTLWNNSAENPLGGEPGIPSLILPSTAPGIEPPPGGSRTVQISLPPWTELKRLLESGSIPGVDAGGFHRTRTVDYVFMLTGEVELVLDESATIVRAGDIVIQRNTLHSWRNHGDGPVEFVATLVALPA
jgi:mannose-6-phosphate isomerase-like protein (cupin superfamily)